MRRVILPWYMNTRTKPDKSYAWILPPKRSNSRFQLLCYLITRSRVRHAPFTPFKCSILSLSPLSAVLFAPESSRISRLTRVIASAEQVAVSVSHQSSHKNHCFVRSQNLLSTICVPFLWLFSQRDLTSLF